MFKSKAPEKDQSTAATLEEAVGRAVQQQHSVVEHPLGREPMTNSSARATLETKDAKHAPAISTNPRPPKLKFRTQITLAVEHSQMAINSTQ
jgi:hypothetical protein